MYQTLTHAYNATIHESTAYSPFCLMFGRHTRLAIDAFLGISPSNTSCKSNQDFVYKLRSRFHQDCVYKLRSRLANAYKMANKRIQQSSKKQKKHYDNNVKCKRLYEGYRVLIRNVGLQGKNKLADILYGTKYHIIVEEQPIEDITVYKVKPETHNNTK